MQLSSGEPETMVSLVEGKSKRLGYGFEISKRVKYASVRPSNIGWDLPDPETSLNDLD